MNEIARQLGFSVSLKARDVVMRAPADGSRVQSGDSNEEDESFASIFGVFSPRKPLQNRRKLFDNDSTDDDDDDDTASTVSLADDTSCSSSEGCAGVSFASPLVTAVFVRPSTTLQENRALYYTDFDYREFRRDYFYRKRESVVRFRPDVVTEVREIPMVEQPDDLYYSQSDLQGYVS